MIHLVLYVQGQVADNTLRILYNFYLHNLGEPFESWKVVVCTNFV